MIGCHPKVLATLSREQFEETKHKVNQCLNHVVGENPQKPPPKRRGNTIASSVYWPMADTATAVLPLTPGPTPFSAHGSPLLPRLRHIEGDMLGMSLPSRSLSDRPLTEEEEKGIKWLGGSTGSLRPPLPHLEEEYSSNFPPIVGVANKTPPSTDSSASTSSGVVKDSPPGSGCYDDTILVMSVLPTGECMSCDIDMPPARVHSSSCPLHRTRCCLWYSHQPLLLSLSLSLLNWWLCYADIPYRSSSANLGSPLSPDICPGDAPDGICRVERIRRAAAECDLVSVCPHTAVCVCVCVYVHTAVSLV